MQTIAHPIPAVKPPVSLTERLYLTDDSIDEVALVARVPLREDHADAIYGPVYGDPAATLLADALKPYLVARDEYVLPRGRLDEIAAEVAFTLADRVSEIRHEDDYTPDARLRRDEIEEAFRRAATLLRESSETTRDWLSDDRVAATLQLANAVREILETVDTEQREGALYAVIAGAIDEALDLHAREQTYQPTTHALETREPLRIYAVARALAKDVL